MRIFISLPILGISLILQSAIFSRILLLRGAADLTLLVVLAWGLQKKVDTALYWGVIAGLLVSIVSALPFGVAVIGYSLAVVFTLLLRRRVWQAPLLAMFAATFIGTLVTQGIYLITLRLAQDPIPIVEAINLITLPSLILNLLIAIPVFGILTDLAGWLYPEPLEV